MKNHQYSEAVIKVTWPSSEEQQARPRDAAAVWVYRPSLTASVVSQTCRRQQVGDGDNNRDMGAAQCL